MEPASFALQHQLQELTDYYSIPQNEYRDNKSSMPRLGNISHVCSDSIISFWDQRTESSTHSMDISPTLYKESNMRTAGQGYDKHFASQTHNDFLPAKVMHGVPDNFSNLSEIIHSSPSRAPELLPVEEANLSSPPDFFSGCNMKGQTLTVAEYFIQAPDTSTTGRVSPKTTALTRPSLPFVSCSLGLSPQVQDMFTSASYDGIYCQRMSYDTHDIQGDSTVPSYPSHSDSSIRGGTDDGPSNSSSKVISGTNYGRPRNYKRSTSFETKDSSAENSKKTKSSCPPLKVRKEKMGDRISALHRLVAPFGKTDTASVLTEAIGYIQFLQDQIQKLSVPYMTKSQSKPVRSVQSVAEGSTEPKRDLRSRGLCVVPLSFASCFNGCA